jgi:hypothetical protein
MALQADLWESDSEFEEALWRLRETVAVIRARRRYVGGSSPASRLAMPE